MIGVQVLSSQNLENLGAQVMGLDPFVVLGMATAACGAVGWLVGPFLGNAIWGLVNRRFKTAVAVVSPFCLSFALVHDKLDTNSIFRKRKSSLTESSDTESILHPILSRTPFQITTVKRLAASRAIDNGSRTSGHTTARGATSLPN
jgi:hypothetical protein